MGPRQVLLLRVKVDIGVIAIKKYFIFLKAPGLDPHHRIQFSVIPGHLFGLRVLPLWKGAVGIFYGPTEQDGIIYREKCNDKKERKRKRERLIEKTKRERKKETKIRLAEIKRNRQETGRKKKPKHE